jgi:RsiW-degrading membrane proteinase PrsW (M82 family)
MHTLILLILAITPGIGIALFIYLRDIRKPEPTPLLIVSMGYGVISFFISLGIGYLLKKYTHIEPQNIAHQMIRAVIFVGLVEEGSKFLFLRGILFRNRRFNEPFDGIVYAVMVGMGFAIAENILYVINGDGGTAIVRMFTAVPAHAVFAVIMGFFLGEAKVFPTSSFLYASMALLFATFVHGYYDYFLFLSFVPGLWLQAIASLVIVVVLTHYAIKLRKDEIRKEK